MSNSMSEIENYIQTYSTNITLNNAQQAVDVFVNNYSNWKKVLRYIIIDGKDVEMAYGNTLVLFSVAISEINPITKSLVDTLVTEINEYENKVKFKFKIKKALYDNLGFCWHKLGSLYDKMAIEAYKKYIYYLLTISNHSSYTSLTCYSFRNCSKFLFQSLINDSLNLSSPTTFNDIFDCPIIELMNNEDEVSKLTRKAYLSGVKVACFVRNEKLPHSNGIFDSPITNDKKNRRGRKEYLTELMWAHYADSHSGICIKYRFPSNVTTNVDNHKNYVAYFSDVEYTSDLKKYSKRSSINTTEAFFVKGKSWKYENELRLLYYNPANNDVHISLPISNSIEAVYFGVKCSEQDKDTIKNILKGRKCISYKHQRIDNRPQEVKEEKDIEFYQMKINEKKFGELKAVKII